jgi:hypothetical protein
MIHFIPARVRKPAIWAVAGAAWAVAWLVRGGHTQWFAILAVIGGIIWAVRFYVDGGRDTDEGALAGSRPDERQKLISVRSRALAGNTAVVASFVGLVTAVAIKGSWWWPFAVILALTGFA